MPRHVEAWVDGVALSSLGPIMVHQVHEDAPAVELTEGERPGRYGQRLLVRKRQTLRVAIEAVIRERFDLAQRSRILEEVARWAQGSVLELSNHPERRLLVTCTSEPTLGEVRDYAHTIRVEFTAYAVPYWEDYLPSGIVISGISGAGTLIIPGTAETPVGLTIRPTDGTLINFTVAIGGQSIALTGLGIPTGGTLTFDRDQRDDLRIVSSGRSQLSHRTAASVDDLFAVPGSVPVSFAANAPCVVTFAVRGRWA